MASFAMVAVLAGACGGTPDEAAVRTSRPVELPQTSTERGDDLRHLVDAVPPGEQIPHGRVTREVPVGLFLILPETPEQALVSRSLPEPFVLGVDSSGKLWGWAPDGRILEPGSTSAVEGGPVADSSAHLPSVKPVV